MEAYDPSEENSFSRSYSSLSFAGVALFSQLGKRMKAVVKCSLHGGTVIHPALII